MHVSVSQVVPASSSSKGDPFVFAGVYDGHGEHQKQQTVYYITLPDRLKEHMCLLLVAGCIWL